MFMTNLCSLNVPFRQNSPDTIVYNQCVNVVLRWVIKVHEGHQVDRPKTIDGKEELPPPFKPGDFDVVIAGFPW
jgi:DNA (cytosine-5)-methyltransferase 1